MTTAPTTIAERWTTIEMRKARLRVSFLTSVFLGVDREGHLGDTRVNGFTTHDPLP
jgi:hypothetical protein